MEERVLQAGLPGQEAVSGIEARFHYGSNDTHAVVLDVPIEKYNKMDSGSQNLHRLVSIRIGGMVSKQLAHTWATQICEQLNQFDVANATVAKLT